MPIIYPPGKHIDHYKIIRSLGLGVASRVYLAQDLDTQQEVVLKFPIDDIIGGVAIFERYQREKEIGVLLDHPGIQRHVNQGEPRQDEYLALEYLHGRNLREVMHEQGQQSMSPAQTVALLIPVCEALIYAHEHGVIHRDIKPENIILLDNGEIKIIDFGIALLKTKQRSRLSFHILSAPVGTPAYMSPERLRGEPGDERADVYAVGVMLYEMLCGQPPFEEQDGFALINEHISHDPPSILQWNPNLSPALATVVMRAIRRDAEKRHATMRDLLDDLGHLDKALPVDYVPDPPRIGGRYRQVIMIAGIVVVVCLLLVAFGFFAQSLHHALH